MDDKFLFLEENLHNIYDLKLTYDELKGQLKSWIKELSDRELFQNDIIFTGETLSDFKDKYVPDIYCEKNLTGNKSFNSIGTGIFYDSKYEFNGKTAFYAYAYAGITSAINNEQDKKAIKENIIEYFRENIPKEIIDEKPDDCICYENGYICVWKWDSFQDSSLKNVPKNLGELSSNLKELFEVVKNLVINYPNEMK